MDAAKLKATLANVGVDVASFKSMADTVTEMRPDLVTADNRRDKASRITLLAYPRHQIVALWDKLMAIRGVTECYPVILGTRRSVLQHYQHMGWRTTTEQFIEWAATANIHAWVAQQWDTFFLYNDHRFTEESVLGDWRPAPPFEPFDPLDALANNLSTRRLIGSGAYQYPQEPLDTPYYLALVPTFHSWQVPAYFDYGDWSACPPPDIHVAMQHLWYTRYGAEIIMLEFDRMTCRVHRPPQTREFAWALASQQMMYSEPMILEHYHSIEQAAADLIEYPVWTLNWHYYQQWLEM